MQNGKQSAQHEICIEYLLVVINNYSWRELFLPVGAAHDDQTAKFVSSKPYPGAAAFAEELGVRTKP